MTSPKPILPAFQPLSERRLEEWHDKVHIMHSAHAAAATRNEILSRGLGTFVAVATAFAGTTLFATLEGSTSHGLRLAAAVLGALAAILSAVQTTLAPGSRAAKHHGAAVRYGALRREMEEWRMTNSSLQPNQAIVEQWGRDWKKAEAEAPEVSAHRLNHATERVSDSKKRQGEAWFPTTAVPNG